MIRENEKMFEKYIGKHLTQRHKAIGLKYARKHDYPELIGPHSYGIVFSDSETDTLIFRIRFESRPLYDEKGRPVPGRNIKTITGIELDGEGYTDFEKAEAKRIAKEYLKLAVEEAE